MPALYPYRLFISHAWQYSDDYKRINDLLSAAPNFTYSNYSVPRDKAFERMSKADLQEQLRAQIRPVGVVVILGGMYVAHSDWIQFEIDFARALSKPIVGISPWGAERIPTAVTNAAAEVVGWNTASIVSAIRRRAP